MAIVMTIINSNIMITMITIVVIIVIHDRSFIFRVTKAEGFLISGPRAQTISLASGAGKI